MVKKGVLLLYCYIIFRYYGKCVAIFLILKRLLSFLMKRNTRFTPSPYTPIIFVQYLKYSELD